MKDLTQRFRPFDRFELRPRPAVISSEEARMFARDERIARDQEDLEEEAAR